MIGLYDMVVKGFCDPDRFGFCTSYNIIAVCKSSLNILYIEICYKIF